MTKTNDDTIKIPGLAERLLARKEAQAKTQRIVYVDKTAKPQSKTPSKADLDDTYGVDLREYLGEDDPGDSEDDWLIKGIVAAGAPQMTAGHPKSKKTFLMLHQSICIAAGIDWLGAFKTQRGRVLVLPREDSVKETSRRIWRLARGLGLDPHQLNEFLKVDTLKPFYWHDEDDVSRIRRTIERWQPSLIVIDSLSRTHMGDENSVKEMAIVTNAWSDICQQTGVAISMIHHFAKAKDNKKTLLQQLRGSGNIGATLRHLVGVDKPKRRDAPFELSFDGNLAGLPDPFQVSMVDDLNSKGQKVIRFELASRVNQSTQSDPLANPILAVLVERLADGATVNKPTLRKGLGAKDGADAAIADMLDLGLGREVFKGRKHVGYEITSRGLSYHHHGDPDFMTSGDTPVDSHDDGTADALDDLLD